MKTARHFVQRHNGLRCKCLDEIKSIDDNAAGNSCIVLVNILATYYHFILVKKMDVSQCAVASQDLLAFS